MGDELIDKINDYSKNLWNPNNLKKTSINTHSWFITKKGKNNEKIPSINYKYENEELEPVEYDCIKKMLLPNENQKKILLSWMDSYIEMYNETLRLIKSIYYTQHRTLTNFKRVRTYFMKKKKRKIFNKSGIKDSKVNTKIPNHTLDYAIKDVCSAYKSAFTNLRLGI